MNNYSATERVERLFAHINAMKKLIIKNNQKNPFCDLKNLGLKIQTARKESGFNQQSVFANKLNVTAAALSRWENNVVYPTIDTLCKIAELTDKPMSYFFGEQPKASYNSDVEDLKKQVFEIKEEMQKYKK